MRKLVIVVIVLVLLFLARSSFFTVDPTEFVYVTQFGEHVATYDGADAANDAGLHFCWPWPVQSVQRLDRRLQYFDLPATELPTRDADVPAAGKPAENRIDKMLIVEAYVCWRIADRSSVDLFIRTLGTSERAQDILGQRINSQLGAAISQMSTSDLINTDASLVRAKVEKLWKGLTESLEQPLRDEYGIELVDVRLRRFYHSPQVTQEIYAAIKAKRKEKAEEYYSRGDEESDRIKKDADKEAERIVAEAHAYKVQKEKDAESKALEIRNLAHEKDEELFKYLKKMEVLRDTLKNNKTLLLLSTHRTFFDMLFQPPIPGAAVGAAPNGSTATPKDNGKGKPASTPAGEK